KKGPDFFELFAPEKEGVLQRTDHVSFETVESRWPQISVTDSISKSDAQRFLSEVKSPDKIQRIINTINEVFPISSNLKNLAIVLLFVAIFKAITLFSHRFATRLLSIRVSRDLRQDSFEHIQPLPMD